MVKPSLPPGFRFHPTDIELVKYYLKRKVMQKKLPRGVIAELDIYKHAPWDLPEKSGLKSRDLKWYFFCPREKKYSSGGRMNRLTEFGFWKTTGNDRPIVHNNEVAGQIKTLIFHRGRAPKGDRTDWVMHEYRLEDTDVTGRGFSQDAYVICMIFQKDGPGPRNGAQYGAPFEECEWDDDNEDGFVNFSNDPNNSHETEAVSVKHSGPSNDSCISEMVPHVSNEATLVPADDIDMMLNQFTENDYWIPKETTKCEVGNPPTHGNADSEPGLDENNIFNGLGDLAHSNPTSLSSNNGHDFFTTVCSSSSDMYPFNDGSYLELIDLTKPIDHTAHGAEFLQNELPCSHATSSGVVPRVDLSQSTLEELQSFDWQMDNYLTNPGTAGQQFHGSIQRANLYGLDCFMD